jgi:O-antigen/teichoic acid export membrane protein
VTSVALREEAASSRRSLLRVVTESLETVATQGAGLLIGIPMLAITAHWLGPQGRGVYVTTTTWAGLTATCSGFSLGLVAIHEMARSGGAEIESLLGTLLAFAAGETILAWGLTATVYFCGPQLFGDVAGTPLILGMLSIPFLITRDYLGSLLIATNRVPAWNRFQLAGTVASFILVAALAGLALVTVERIIMAWLCGVILMCALSLRKLRGRLANWGVRSDLARSLLRGGCKLHVNSIGGILISSIDVLMVNAFIGAREVGYYQLALKLTTNIAAIAQAVGTVTYGRVVESGPDASWSLIRRISGLTMGLMIVVAILAEWCAPWIVHIVAGSSFASSIPLFRLTLLAIPGLSIAYLMSPQWICRGFFWQASGLTVLVATVSALGNWILIPRFGAMGAAYGFVGVYLVSMLANGGIAGLCEWRWRTMEKGMIAR